MHGSRRPQADLRSTVELINFALTESDRELAWDAVRALHWLGTREVLEEARSLCRSQCPRERELGADILGQLGVWPRTFPEEGVAILSGMLSSEVDAVVLESIFIAFSFLHEPAAVPVIVPFCRHAGLDVRVAVAKALSGHDDPRAIRSLVELSGDDDAEVRNWATFGLGTQTELNTHEIREALVQRLDDCDDETFGEALVGLARRGDRRVIPSLITALGNDNVDHFALEAAELIAAPELSEPLNRLKCVQTDNLDLLDRASAACSETIARTSRH